MIVLVLALIVVVRFGPWIWALVDAIRVPDDSSYQSGSTVVGVLVICSSLAEPMLG